MRNRRFIPIAFALFILAGGGKAELPETTWLFSYLSARRADFDTLPKYAYRYVGGLDEAGTEKLRALLSKIATNSPEVNANDYVAAREALLLLGAAKAPGLVETAIPLLEVSRISIDATAAEVMGRTGSEAAVEAIEAAFQRNLKAQFDGKARVPDKTGRFMYALALNGTPKARAAFERARTQFLEAYKTNNIELSQVDRESLENLWSKVQNELAKEKAERGLPDPSEARRIGPAVPRDSLSGIR